jgi:iron(III) transport system permease protein
MSLQAAISSSINAFRDGWRLFAVLSILACAALILVPQFRLLTASLIREGGRFTIQHHVGDQRLEFITATADNYDSKGQPHGLSITDDKGQPFLDLRSRDPQSVIVSEHQGGMVQVQDLPGGRIAIKVGDRIFAVSQEAPIAIFAPSEARRILAAVPRPDGGLLLEHSRGAFLTFVDSSRQLSTWNYAAFLSSHRYLGALWNSALVTVVSTAIATIIGVALAYLVARFSIPGGTRLILTLVAIASISPSFLGAYAWRLLFSSNGILVNLLDLEGSIVGTHGVIWVLVWLNFPIVFLLSYDAFAGADEAMHEAAMSVGANRWLTFVKVELPLAAPGIITGLYLAAMAAFTDFGTPSIISLDINILPVVIYRDFMGEIGSNPSMASTGSIIMVLISTLLLAAQRAYLAALSFASIGGRRTMVRSLSPKLRVFVTALVWGTLGVAFVPHLTVLVTSFLEWRSGIVTATVTLANYWKLFALHFTTIEVSLFLSIAATLLDAVLGMGIAYIIVRKHYRFISSTLNTLVMVPYIIPGTVLGIGLVVIFNEPPLLITGTALILILSYFIRNLPFVVKTTESVLYQIHPTLEEAAVSLGARPFRTFLFVTAPLMAGGIATGATLAFLNSMTDLSSTIVLYRPPWKPMTAVIFENTIDANADFGIAAAMTAILLPVLCIPLYFITKMRGVFGAPG